MKDMVIHNMECTNEHGHLVYLNTGRDNVSGLYYSNNYIKNNKYNYIKVLNIRMSPDTALVYPIHECFLLTTVRDTNEVISNIVSIDALVKYGNVENIKISCTPINHFDVTNAGQVHDLKAALKLYENYSSLGIWLCAKWDKEIIIKRLSSLAYNEIPNNIQNQFLQCDYECYYMNNENINSNTVETENEIGNMIANSYNINESIIAGIKRLDDHIMATGDNKYLNVLYRNHTFKDINTDEIIRPDSCEYLEINNTFVDIRSDYIRMRQIGNYIIALKVDMDVVGDTNLELSVYINNKKIKELSSHMCLNTDNKIRAFGFLAGQIQKLLLPSDKIHLKMRTTNTDITIKENNCRLQIIKL